MGLLAKWPNPKIQKVLFRWHVQFLWWKMFQWKDSFTPKWLLIVMNCVYCMLCRLYIVCDFGDAETQTHWRALQVFPQELLLKKKGRVVNPGRGNYCLAILVHFQGLFCQHDHQVIHRATRFFHHSGQKGKIFDQQVLEGFHPISPSLLGHKKYCFWTSQRHGETHGFFDRLSNDGIWSLLSPIYI